MANIADMSFEKRVGDVMERTSSRVGPEIGAQLRALIDPASLTIMAAVLTAWIVGHALAYGELIDLVIVGVGVVAIGTAIFEGAG